MLAYILFIFIAVFTRPLYANSKWSYIVTAITVTSWALVIADAFSSVADILQDNVKTTRPRLESYLVRLQHHIKINNRQDIHIKDQYGADTEKTIGQTLKNSERSVVSLLETLNKEEKQQKRFSMTSELFVLVGFILFFCILLFEPIFVFFNKQLDGLTALAFGTILASQFASNFAKSRIQSIRDSLDTMNEAIDLLNQSYETEIIQKPDSDI